MTDQKDLPTDGQSFVKRLMPSAIVAMAGTELVSYLQLEGSRKFDPKQRTAVFDAMLARGKIGPFSIQGQDRLRRAMHRIANNVDSSDPAWGSLAMVRGTVTLSLWQTALEQSTFLGGQLICSKETGKRCEHEQQGFRRKWDHYIGSLSRMDGELSQAVTQLFAVAGPTIKLRHRLVHGIASGQDGVHLEETDPTMLNRPLSELREGIIQAVLITIFKDNSPDMTIHRAHFEVLGLPQEILDETLRNPIVETD